MTDAFSNRHVASWAHNLTIRLLAHIGVELTHDQGDQLWNALRDVAEGKLTVMSGAAEMLRPFPQAPEELKDDVWAHINLMVQRDRDVAKLIWDDFEGTLTWRKGTNP